MVEQTKDPFEEEKNHKARLSTEAKELLANPMLQGFFEYREQECFEAFRRLPLGTKLEEFQVVQHDLLSIGRLKQTLEEYVANFNLLEIRERQIDVEGI